jgi:hypothetical protein
VKVEGSPHRLLSMNKSLLPKEEKWANKKLKQKLQT